MESPAPPRRFHRSYAVHFLSQAGVHLAGIFIPLQAHALGATPFAVGAIGAVFGLSLFVAAFVFGRAADQYGRRVFIRGGLLLSSAAVLLHLLPDSPWQLAAARGAFGAAVGIFPAALTAYAFDNRRKLGRFSAWGSLGSAAGALVAALAGLSQGVFLGACAFLAVAFLVSLRFDHASDRTAPVPIFPWTVLRRNRWLYLGVILRHVGAASVWVIFPIYLVEELHGTPAAVAVLTATNAATQFFLMNQADRFPARALVTSGLALSAVVFLGIAFATDWKQTLPIQFVLAASWSALWVGSLKDVMARNVERATGTGLLHSAAYLSNVVGPFFGGAVAHFAGFRWTILVAAGLCVVALVLYRVSALTEARD
ncbi:MAG: MFS transporter [Methanobacteriota archaeon]